MEQSLKSTNCSFNDNYMFTQARYGLKTSDSGNSENTSTPTSSLTKMVSEIRHHFEGTTLLGSVRVKKYIQLITDTKLTNHKDKLFGERIKTALLAIYETNKAFEKTMASNQLVILDPIENCGITQDVEMIKGHHEDPKIFNFHPGSLNSEPTSFCSDMLSDKNFISSSSVKNSPPKTTYNQPIPKNSVGLNISDEANEKSRRDTLNINISMDLFSPQEVQHNEDHTRIQTESLSLKDTRTSEEDIIYSSKKMITEFNESPCSINNVSVSQAVSEVGPLINDNFLDNSVYNYSGKNDYSLTHLSEKIIPDSNGASSSINNLLAIQEASEVFPVTNTNFLDNLYEQTNILETIDPQDVQMEDCINSNVSDETCIFTDEKIIKGQSSNRLNQYSQPTENSINVKETNNKDHTYIDLNSTTKFCDYRKPSVHITQYCRFKRKWVDEDENNRTSIKRPLNKIVTPESESSEFLNKMVLMKGVNKPKENKENAIISEEDELSDFMTRVLNITDEYFGNKNISTQETPETVSANMKIVNRKFNVGAVNDLSSTFTGLYKKKINKLLNDSGTSVKSWEQVHSEAEYTYKLSKESCSKLSELFKNISLGELRYNEIEYNEKIEKIYLRNFGLSTIQTDLHDKMLAKEHKLQKISVEFARNQLIEDCQVNRYNVKEVDDDYSKFDWRALLG